MQYASRALLKAQSFALATSVTEGTQPTINNDLRLDVTSYPVPALRRHIYYLLQ